MVIRGAEMASGVQSTDSQSDIKRCIEGENARRMLDLAFCDLVATKFRV